jgi:hypothetical protein
MNNIILVGAILVIAAIVITVLSIKLHRKKKQISLDEAVDTVKNEVQNQQNDVLQQTSELIKDLPPVDGPDAVVVDSDNPYSITNNEPLVVGEKSTIEDICGKVDAGEILATPIASPEVETPVVPEVKAFTEVVKKAEEKPAKRTRKKKEPVKVEKKTQKKTKKVEKPVKTAKVKKNAKKYKKEGK